MVTGNAKPLTLRALADTVQRTQDAFEANPSVDSLVALLVSIETLNAHAHAAGLDGRPVLAVMMFGRWSIEIWKRRYGGYAVSVMFVGFGTFFEFGFDSCRKAARYAIREAEICRASCQQTSAQ